MPEDEKMKKKLAEKDEEIAELKKKLKSKNQEDDEDEAKLKNAEEDEEESKSKNAEEDEEKMKNLKSSNSKLKARADAAEKRLGDVEMRLQREQYGRSLDSLHAEGYQVGDSDSDDRNELLTEIVTSVDPDAKLTFLKKHIRKLTLRKTIDTTLARIGDPDGDALIEKQQQAAKFARERVDELAEETKDYAVASRKFGKFLNEELKKLGISGDSTRREAG